MSQTNRQKQKAKKLKARERRIARARNVHHNLPSPKFLLNVISQGKIYKNIMKFRNQAELDNHIAKTEAARQAGQEIHEGEVVDAVTGEIIMKIAASPAKDFKGTLPSA